MPTAWLILMNSRRSAVKGVSWGFSQMASEVQERVDESA